MKTQPTSIGDSVYNEDYSLILYRSSANYLFREMVATLSIFEGEYRVVVSLDDDTLSYSVPAELKPHFDQISKKYIEEYKGED